MKLTSAVRHAYGEASVHGTVCVVVRTRCVSGLLHHRLHMKGDGGSHTYPFHAPPFAHEGRCDIVTSEVPFSLCVVDISYFHSFIWHCAGSNASMTNMFTRGRVDAQSHEARAWPYGHCRDVHVITGLHFVVYRSRFCSNHTRGAEL